MKKHYDEVIALGAKKDTIKSFKSYEMFLVALKVFKAAQCAKAEVLALRRLLAGKSGEENLPGARHCARLLGLARAQCGPRFAIALEWAEGCDIATLCLSEARPYLKMLLETLRFAHSQGVLHRDLKPENIMMSADNPPQAKLADFGLAGSTAAQSMLLRSACGTALFMAPEMMTNMKVRSFNIITGKGRMGRGSLKSFCEAFG